MRAPRARALATHTRRGGESAVDAMDVLLSSRSAKWRARAGHGLRQAPWSARK